MTEATSRRSAYSRLLDRAVRILAMRDHSEQELRRKLAAPVMGKNGPEEIDATPEDYDKVIAWCIESRYLDDDRFVQQFIASRSRKGYGPARVRQELNQKGSRVKLSSGPCVSAKLTGQCLRVSRPFGSTVNLYLSIFQIR
jgi:regulatory protein